MGSLIEQRVDVVVPAYNAERYIEYTLQSILDQGAVIFQVIIVDDGSTDHTVKCIEAFKSKNPSLTIRCLQQKNAGPSAARNLGISHCSSEFIALVDADDIWAPQKITRQLEKFDHPKYSNLGVVYCGFGLIGACGEKLQNTGFKLNPEVRGNVYDFLIHANLIAGSASSVLIKHECFKHLGVFDDSLVCAEDWDLWLRFSSQYTFDYVNEELLWIRQHSNNAQKNELRMLGGELLFLNKLFLNDQMKWFHLWRFRRRVVLGRFLPAHLDGWESCEPKLRSLLSGWRMYVSKVTILSYYKIRNLIALVKRGELLNYILRGK